MADINKNINIKVTTNSAEVQNQFESLRNSIKETEKEIDRLASQFGENSKEADAARKNLAALNNEYTKLSKTAVDLGASFEDINGDIKPLTAQLGELEDRLYALRLAGKENTDEFAALTAEAGRYRQAQIQTDLAVDAAAKTFADKLGGALQGVAAGFAIAQGAAGLFGEENENVEKALLKVQSALALVQGISAFRQSIPDVKAFITSLTTSNVVLKANAAAGKVAALTMGLFSKSVNTTSTSFKVLKGAIAATGIGLLVVAIGELVANFDKITAALSGTTKQQQAYNDVMKETIASSAAEIASLDALYASSQDLTKSIDDRRAAAIELQNTYPETFANFTQEEILAGKASTAYQNLRNEIVATALAKAKQAQIDAKAAELAEEEADKLAEIQRLREQQKNAPEQRGSRVETYYGAGGGGSTVVSIPSKADIQKRIDEVQGEINRGRKELGKFAEEIGAIEAPVAKTAEQITKERTANTIKGEIEAQKRRVETLKAQGKNYLDAQLKQAQLELKLLQNNGQSTFAKETEIEALRTQIKQKAASDRANRLKALNDKEKAIYDESVKNLEATYNKEKATLDAKLQSDLAEAKSLDEKVRLQKEYAAAIKTLDENLVTGKFDALAQLQKGNKLDAAQEKEKTAELTNIQTEYVKNIGELDDQLKELNDQRTEAEKERQEKFAQLVADATAQDLDNLQKKIENELSLIDESNAEQIAKAKELRLQLLAIEKQKAIDAETARSGGIIAELQKALDAELKLYEGNEEKQKEIKGEYKKQIEDEEKQSAENILAINKEYTDKGLIVDKEASDKSTEITKEEADKKKELRQQVFDKSVELANNLADLAQAILEKELEALNNQYEEIVKIKERENEQELSNLELTNAQRLELERQQALELEAIEAERLAKEKELKKKQADIDFAITIANIAAQTALAVISALKEKPPLGLILAGLNLAAGVAAGITANVQRQKVKALKRGGFISGPGGPLDDMVPAMLSNGEAVINAAAVDRFAPLLSAINQSTGGDPIIPKFAAGGVVTANPGEVSVTNIQDIAAVAGQTAVRAYILDADVSSQSAKNARIQRLSRIK